MNKSAFFSYTCKEGFQTLGHNLDLLYLNKFCLSVSIYHHTNICRDSKIYGKTCFSSQILLLCPSKGKVDKCKLWKTNVYEKINIIADILKRV